MKQALTPSKEAFVGESSIDVGLAKQMLQHASNSEQPTQRNNSTVLCNFTLSLSLSRSLSRSVPDEIEILQLSTRLML